MSDARREWRPGRRELELDDELRFHLDLEIEKLTSEGVHPAEARRLALIEFGGVEKVKEECRDERSGRSFEVLIQDLKYALRSLRRQPGYVVAAVLTLALGIGADTAIFSLIHGVQLEPLPYAKGEELMVLRQGAPEAGANNVPFSIKEFEDVRDQNRLLDVVEYHSMSFSLLGRGEPRRVLTGVVSADFFDVLGVTPERGRFFVEEDEAHGAEAVLVLGYGFWQRAFGGDASVVGQVFEMNNRPHTVVGVLPQVPQFPRENDVYMPTSACPFRAAGNARKHEDRNAFRSLTVFGRLQEGAHEDMVESDLSAVGQHFAQDYPAIYDQASGYQLTAKSLQDELTAKARPLLWLLLGATALVLLIACTNVANLALARMVRREREMAVRATLGASRGRLTRQVLSESVLVAALGGVLGLGVAYAGLDLLARFMARFTPRAESIGIDGWVLVFALAISVFTGLLFGALPAFSQRYDLASSLREKGAGSTLRSLRFRNLLIAAQVAIAVMLLVGAGLLLRSLDQLNRVDGGFDSENVLTARVSLNWTKYSTGDLVGQFFDGVIERLQGHPGVVSAAVGSMTPMARQGPWSRTLQVEDRPLDESQTAPQVAFQIASEDYFPTLGIPLIKGRIFTLSDHNEAPPVAVVNASLARKLWPDRDALGRRVSLDGLTWIEIVGVVADVRQYGLDVEAAEELYVPFQQNRTAMHIIARTRSDAAAMASVLKDIVWSVDPDQPIDAISTLEQARRQSIETPKLTTLLLGVFALLALLITTSGIGSVIAYAVGQRKREIGVRIALGAKTWDVVGMVIWQGLMLVGAGLVVGLIGALALGRVMEDLLFQVDSRDPLTLVLVSAVLLSAAVVACLLPAWRAARVHPATALRAD